MIAQSHLKYQNNIFKHFWVSKVLIIVIAGAKLSVFITDKHGVLESRTFVCQPHWSLASEMTIVFRIRNKFVKMKAKEF